MIKNALVIAATVPLAFMLHSCSMTTNSPVQTVQNTDITQFIQPNVVSSCDLDHSEIPHLPPDIFEHVNALCDVKLLAAGSDLVGLAGNVATTEKSRPVRAALTSHGPADILKMFEPVRREKPNAELSRSPLPKLFGGFPKTKTAFLQSGGTVTHIRPDDPPFSIVHSDAPIVTPNPNHMQRDRLMAARVSTEIHVVQPNKHSAFTDLRQLELNSQFFEEQLN